MYEPHIVKAKLKRAAT